MYIHPKSFILSTECFTACDILFSNILWIFRGHSPECLATFPGIFGDIPRNVWGHSPECLATFLGMFEDIPWNVWPHSSECLRTFPGMFEDIPRNVWPHSPEYSIPRIRRVPRIPFPVPVFLVLYIAWINRYWCTLILTVCSLYHM